MSARLLIALACVVIGAATGRSQTTAPPAGSGPRDDLEHEMATLRRLVSDVENKGWVLIPSRGSTIAISRDQYVEILNRGLIFGTLHPDSVEPRARRILPFTRERLALLKQQLAELEANRWPAGRGPVGSWYLNCSGDYPPRMEGPVHALSVGSDGHFGFALRLRTSADSEEFPWVVPNGKLRADYTARGRQQWVRLSQYGGWTCYTAARGSFCESTLEWDAEVRLIQRASDPRRVDGVIHGKGSLALTGDPAGSCTGAWSAP